MPRGRLVLALLALAGPLASGDAEVERGRFIEGISCRSDPTQTYTLYLPSKPTERPPPGLIVLDPRGRSVHAAERFRQAAEEYGWVLLSSNDSRSDTRSGQPNVVALRTLWPEAGERYGVDPRRTYLAGFSGTAKFAWAIARQSTEVAGVIASGAGWEPRHFDMRVSFPSFGTAGSTDFNYTPMQEIHTRLREWGTPERLEIFDGSHTWMPAALARQAVEWMEVQAMRRGLRPTKDTLVARLLDEDLSRASELESEGRLLDAQRRYAAAADTFDGLASVTAARQNASRLAALPDFERLLEDEQRWDRYELSMWKSHREGYAAIRGAEAPFRTALYTMRFRIGELREHAEAEGYEGIVGRRLLETLATSAGYYLAGDLMRQGEYGRATLALSMAVEARSDSPYYWYNLACCRARVGARGSALDALEKAISHGFSDAELLASDADLESLRGEDRFRDLAASLRTAR